MMLMSVVADDVDDEEILLLIWGRERERGGNGKEGASYIFKHCHLVRSILDCTHRSDGGAMWREGGKGEGQCGVIYAGLLRLIGVEGWRAEQRRGGEVRDGETET